MSGRWPSLAGLDRAVDLYAFLTAAPNADVVPSHAKATRDDSDGTRRGKRLNDGALGRGEEATAAPAGENTAAGHHVMSDASQDDLLGGDVQAKRPL
jgi:hypothetical protein